MHPMTEHGTATETSPEHIPEWAKERAEALQGIYIHAIVFVLFNLGLFGINWATRGNDGSWWFVWPLGIWGVGFVIHLATMTFPVFSTTWVERRAEEIARRRG